MTTRLKTQVVLARDTGAHLLTLHHDMLAGTYIKTVNDTGVFNLTYTGQIPQDLLGPDRLVMVWLAFQDRPPVLDFVGLVDFWEYHVTEGDNVVTIVSGKDLNVLLGRRVVTWAAGTAQAQLVNVPLDDGLKDIVVNNLGASAGAGRDLTSAGFLVDADTGLGDNVTKGFSWREVANVLKGLSEQSQNTDSPIFHWVEVGGLDVDGTLALSFKTAKGQPGPDHGINSPYPIVFGPSLGNMYGVRMTWDWRDVISHVYVGGPGEGEDREIVTRTDTTRSGVSVYGRREHFIQATQERSTAGLESVGDEILATRRPVTKVIGMTSDNQVTRYGLDWNVGHRVMAEALGHQLDVVIRKVVVRMGPNGVTVQGYMEGEVI